MATESQLAMLEQSIARGEAQISDVRAHIKTLKDAGISPAEAELMLAGFLHIQKLRQEKRANWLRKKSN